MEYNTIIAIDPDIERNGVATLDTATHRLSVEMMDFGHTLAALDARTLDARTTGKKIVVLVEAGWLNVGNYHLTPYDTVRTAARKGMDQGRNHQRGIDIIEYCKFQRITCEEVRPLQKACKGYHIWNGKDGKITQDEIEEVTGQKLGRLNQDGRDAALIAWTYAGLPIFVKPKSNKNVR